MSTILIGFRLSILLQYEYRQAFLIESRHFFGGIPSSADPPAQNQLIFSVFPGREDNSAPT